MRTYIIKRLYLMVPTLFLVTIIVFLSVRLIPGDVIDVMIGQMAGTGTSIGGLNREAIEHSLGLDVPMQVQYGRWLLNAFQGDLGTSLMKRAPVLAELKTTLPVSLELGLLGIVLSLIISIPIGVYSAIRQDTVGDYFARSFAIACIAIPGFWLGTMVMVLPSAYLGWSPPMEYIPFGKNPGGNIVQFIIPSVIVGMGLAGTIMRMTRTMMLEVLRQDYIRTAWAKGLTEKVVILRHALKNSMIPVISIVGTMLPIIIGGTVIIEEIFVLPGVGRLALTALNQRDYPVVQAVNLVVAVFVLAVNLLVDLAYGYIDPRVHYG